LPWSSDNRPIIVPPSTESLGKRNHDLRNRSTGVYQQYPYCADQAEETGVDIAVKDFWHFPSTPFDADCVEAVRAAAEAQGFAHRDIVSGAGHDAVYMARIAPTGMIFVPCEGGISHNEEENATPEDCAAGCDVLLAAVLEKAGVVENP